MTTQNLAKRALKHLAGTAPIESIELKVHHRKRRLAPEMNLLPEVQKSRIEEEHYFTAYDVEVLNWVATGLSDTDIAKQMHKSVSSIRVVVYNARNWLRAETRVQLVLIWQLHPQYRIG